MISKKQFVSLVDGLKKQHAFEDKVDEAFGMLNSSFTVCELSTALSNAISDAIVEDFDNTVVDIINDYVYMGTKKVEWSDEEINYSFKFKDSGQLYDNLCKYFRGEER